MKQLLLVLCVGLLFTACASKPPTIEIKLDGQQIPFAETKSAWITAQDAIYGSSAAGPQGHCLRWITLRNYEYEVKGALSANEGKLADGQVKLFLSVHDEAGTNKATPIKVATFNGANSGPLQFEFINLTVFKDGKEESYQVSLSGQANRQESEVKILSVTNDTVTGEVNVNVKTDDKVLTIKGPFTAKIFKP